MKKLASRVRALLDGLEETVNPISDADRQWWPFLFLRPPRRRRLGSLRMGLLALLYGLPGGLFADLMLLAAGQRPDVWVFPLLFSLSLFGAYRGIFAYFWNRRADRLVRTAALLADALDDTMLK